MDSAESKIFIQHGIDVTIITFHDEKILEEKHIKELEESIMPAVEDGQRENLMLDFSNVRFLSSTFLGLLIKIHKRICERKGHLKLCNINPDIYKVFEITQLNKVFDIS
jgi:anti-sigma B factor antagonist